MVGLKIKSPAQHPWVPNRLPHAVFGFGLCNFQFQNDGKEIRLVNTLRFCMLLWQTDLFLFLFWSIAYIIGPFNDRENQQHTMKYDISPVLYMPPGAKMVKCDIFRYLICLAANRRNSDGHIGKVIYQQGRLVTRR